MALDPKVQAIIEILLRDRGTREAVLGMAKVGGQAEKSSAQMGLLSQSVGFVGKSLLTWFGAAMVGRWALSAVEAFAKVERSFEATRIQAEGLGVGLEKLGEARKFLEGLQAAGDGLLTETVPAFQRFLGLTKSVNGATFATKLASGMAESGLVSFGEAVDTISALLSGKAARSLKNLGINLQEAEDGSVDAAKAIELASEKFLTMGDRVGGLQDKLDRFSGRMEQLKIAFGGFLATVTAKLEKWRRENLEALAIAAPGVKGNKILNFLYPGLGDVDFTVAPPAWVQAGEAAGDAFSQGQADAIAVAALASEAKRQAENAKRLKEIQTAVEKRAKTEIDAELEAQDKLARELADKRREEGAATLAAYRAEIEAKLALTEEGTRERMKLELELLTIAQEEEIQKAIKHGGDLNQVYETFAMLNAAVMAKYDDAAAAAAWDTAIRKLEASEAERKGRIRDAALTGKALTDWEKYVAEMKRQVGYDIARRSVETLGLIFGKGKAFAIANAIIATHEGVAGALAHSKELGPHLALVYATVIAAAGAAEVAAIIATHPGSTGMGGGHRRRHGGGGRGGAETRAKIPGLTGAKVQSVESFGTSPGISPAGAPATTVDRRVTTTTGDTYDFRGATILDEKKLARIIRRANIRDRGKFVR